MCIRFSNKLILIAIALGVFISSIVGCSPSDSNDEPELTTKTLYFRDYAYYRGMIFDLGKPSDFETGDKIIQLLVFRNYIIPFDSLPGSLPEGRMFVDPNDTTIDTLQTVHCLVEDVLSEYFTVDTDKHFIIFNYSGLTLGRDVGVYMKIERANGDTVEIGDISTEPYSLKLIASAVPHITESTWDYEWRNVYQLTSLIGEVDSVKVEVWMGGLGDEDSASCVNSINGTTFNQIMGIDSIFTHQIIDLSFGLLVFPDKQPFDPSGSFAENNQELEYTVPEIYTETFAHYDAMNASKYYIKYTTYKLE